MNLKIPLQQLHKSFLIIMGRKCFSRRNYFPKFMRLRHLKTNLCFRTKLYVLNSTLIQFIVKCVKSFYPNQMETERRTKCHNSAGKSFRKGIFKEFFTLEDFCGRKKEKEKKKVSKELKHNMCWMLFTCLLCCFRKIRTLYRAKLN